jgi:hypothetical protein
LADEDFEQAENRRASRWEQAGVSSTQGPSVLIVAVTGLILSARLARAQRTPEAMGGYPGPNQVGEESLIRREGAPRVRTSAESRILLTYARGASPHPRC